MNPSSLAAGCAAFFLAASLFSHTVAARLTFLGCGVLCCAVALAREWRSLSALPPIWLPFLLWAIWCAASLFWSQEPERSFKEFRSEMFYSALALWVCYVGAQARLAPRIIAPFLAAATALVCILALHHFATAADIFAESWHGGPGNLSSALITLLPCVAMGAWRMHRNGERVAPALAAALATLMLAAAYTTLNRTIWIAFTVQFVLIGSFLATRERLPVERHLRRVALLIGIGLIATAALMTFRIQAEREATGMAELSRDPRTQIWDKVLESVRERPLTGYGFGRGLFRGTLTQQLGSGLHWHAHNFFLDLTLQAGLPALLLFLVLLGALFREAWRMARRADAVASACGIALLAVVAGMIIRNMTDTLLVRQNALLFWGIVGVLLAWGRPQPQPA